MKRYIIAPVVLLIFMGIFALIIRACSKEMQIDAAISKNELSEDEIFTFYDSTPRAKEWLWQMGDGYTATSANGEYKFTKQGQYKIRLTVNGKYERHFLVNVLPNKQVVKAETPRIVAPSQVFEGELVHFKATGITGATRWELSGDYVINSRERNPSYTYTTAGLYRVKLNLDNHPPLTHNIEVLTKYTQVNIKEDNRAKAGIDFHDRLQLIVNGNAFNEHYNFILNTYLCGNPNVKVLINNSRNTDFYSYCQGLRITGKSNKTIIESTVVETDPNKPDCVSIIHVTQTP